MSMDTAELVSQWDSVPFDGGYEGLRTLQDREFSGAVVSGSARLFMLNGTVVGILDGDLDSFEDAAGTARAAPHESLPLLVVMQARADDPRAQYYTQDTPISDVDRTLSDGKFTGYVELSENVLSGDYYLVYHQGRQMSVAWVGSSQKLVTDDDAFEQADGEVGIYKVFPAEIEPVELPAPEPEPGGGGVASTPSESGSPATDDGGVSTTQPETPDEPTSTEPSAAAEDPAGDDETRDERRRGTASGPPGSKAAGASQGTAVDSTSGGAEGRPQSQTGTDESRTSETDQRASSQTPEERQSRTTGATETNAGGTAERTERERSGRSTSDPPDTTQADPEAFPSAESDTPEPAGTGYESVDDATGKPEPATEQSPGEESAGSADDASPASLETRSIPSLDPERSTSDGEIPTEMSQDTTTSPSAEPSEPQQQADRTPQRRDTDALEAELQKRETQITDLEAEIRELMAENEELAAERDRLQADLEDARAEIRRLEERLDAADTGATGSVQLSAAEAIDGTNLFVRYHSKGEATLAKAQDGSVDREAVEENIRLEYHTQFDGDDAVVNGDPFETFLQESLQYRFVDWLVRKLLYEIRDTGHANKMSVLYEALPKIDRAELNGKVSMVYTEDGQEHREQAQFDVVVRDRMGNPLVVANINDSREAATDAQMTDIIQTAERVGNSSGSLTAAFLVTSSFFEPEALETAEEATSSGLLSRDKRKSFVNLSRKDGYHLCLLEARNREFHLAVPEL